MALLRLVLAIVLTLLQQGAPAASAREAGSAHQTPGAEYFVLELAPAPDAPRPALPTEVGLATWRRRVEADGQQCEWELRFRDDDTRVLQVERVRDGRRELVWREWRPGSGRTLLASRDPASASIELVEWGRRQSLRLRFEAAGAALFPLELLELARRGELAAGPLTLFDPLSRSLSEVRAAITVADRPEPSAERTLALSRPDGTCAGTWRLRGEELLGFRWQDGGLEARRIDAEEHARRLAAMEPLEPGELVRR